MDIKELLYSPGLTVKNPEKKRKNDGKPETITIPYTKDNSSSVYSDFNKATEDYGQMFPQVDNPRKYDKHGITISRNIIGSLDKELAEAQSNWDKTFNSIAQIGNELVLGSAAAIAELPTMTAKAPAVLFDQLFKSLFDNYKGDNIQKFLGVDDNDYSNAVSEKINEWKDYFDNNVVPIYQDPNVNISNGGLLNWGWWMGNMPTIASTLTLLAPAKLATFGVAKLGRFISKASHARKIEKAIKAAKTEEAVAAAKAMGAGIEEEVKLNRLQRGINNPITMGAPKQAGQTTAEALIMRTAENFQEAHQTYNDAYEDASERLSKMSSAEYNQVIENFKDDLDANEINKNDRNAVAKFIARRSADRTFMLDYSNTFFDIWQLGALRQFGRIGRSVKSVDVRRANREFLRQLSGKGEPGRFKKLAERSWDGLKGSGNLVASELSEGVEEIVNYIAQMEGLTYGKALMDGETDATLNGFINKRILDYKDNPEMWESGFWGVFGGVAFGGGMNAIRSVQAKRASRKLQKNIKEIEEETGQRVNVEDWLLRGEVSEVAKAKAAIVRRTQRINDMKTRMEAVEQKKNPYAKNADGTFKDFDGDVELQQALAREQLMNEFITETTIDELTNGTYELFTDALSTKEVRDWFVANNLISENEVDNYINNILKRAHDVKNDYNKQLSHVNYQVAALNKKLPMADAIPIEYVQQIAKNNLMFELKNKEIDRKIAALDNIAGGISSNLSAQDKIETQHLIQLQMLQDYYGRLTAQERLIKEGGGLDSNGRPLSEWRKAETLDDLKQQKEAVLSAIKSSFEVNGELSDSSNEEALGAMLYAIKSSFGYRMSQTGQVTFDQTDANFNKTDAEIIEQFNDIFKASKATDKATVLGQLSKTLNNKIGRITGKNGLYEQNVRLFDMYQDRAALLTERRVNASMIASTQSAIRNAVDVLHNRNNQLRKEKIKLAEQSIRQLHDKYQNNESDITQIIIDAFFNDRAAAYDLARQKLTGINDDGTKDSQIMIDALNIINFSRGANRSVYKYISEVLQANAEKHRRARVNSSTNQNQSQAQQNQGSNNPSSTPQQAATSPANGQNQGATAAQQPTQQPTQQPAQSATPGATPSTTPTPIQQSPSRSSNNVYVTVKIDANGNPTYIISNRQSADAIVAKPVTLNNNTSGYELDMSSVPEGQRIKYYNSNLFEPHHVDMIMDEATIEVVQNPIISKLAIGGYTTVQQGRIQGQYRLPDGTVTLTEPTQEQNVFGGGIGGQLQGGTQTNISPTGEVDDGGEELTNEEFVNSEVMSLIDWNDVSTIDYVTIEQTLRSNIANSTREFASGEADALVASAMQLVRQAVDSLQNSNSDPNAAAIAFMSKLEDTMGSVTLESVFSQSIDNLLVNYAKTQLVPTVNVDGVDRYVIRAADILRICNNALGETSDLSVAKSIYDLLVSYLDSVRGKAAFRCLDLSDLKSGKVLDYLNKSEQELLEEWYGRPDVLTNKAQLLNSEFNQNLDEIDNLQIGDELSIQPEYDMDGNKRRYILTTSNGIPVGKLEIPYYTQQNGYAKYNDGLLTAVKLDANGNPVSDAMNFVLSIFCGNTVDAATIRGLLTTAATSSVLTEADYMRYGAQLANVPLMQQYLNGIDSDGRKLVWINEDGSGADFDIIFKGLLKLWNYSYTTNPFANTTTIRDSVIKWYKHLYKEYNNIYNYDTNNSSIKIAYINEGTPNLISAHPNYNTCVNISTIPSHDKIRLAQVERSKGTITISNPVDNVPSFSTNSHSEGTNIVIYTRNKKPTIVKAFGVLLNDKNLLTNQNAKELFIASRQALYDAILQAIRVDDQASRNKVVDIIHSMVATNATPNDRIPLFRATRGTIWFKVITDARTGAENGIELTYRDVQGKYHNMHLYWHGSIGRTPGYWYKSRQQAAVYKTSNVTNEQVANSMSLALVTFLTDHCQINVDSRAIEADNTNKVTSAGFIKRTNGNGQSKLVIDIPNTNAPYRAEYDTFNDYIINNDLVKVNIKPDSNSKLFNRNDNLSSTNHNQQLIVELSTSPVREMKDDEVYNNNYSQSDTDATVRQKVLDIVNDKTVVNPMAAIFNAIGRPQLYQRLESLADAETLNALFPPHITYNSELNVLYKKNGKLNESGPVANTNPLDDTDRTYRVMRRKTNNRGATIIRQVTQRTRKGWVVVGNKWVNMASSTDTSRQNNAIRHMIHERLHQLFHSPNVDKESILNDLASIYNVFKQRLDAGHTIQNADLNYIRNIVSRYDAVEDKNRLYEEFMVEAITSPSFYNYLNSIILTDSEQATLAHITGVNKKESLFDKIINLIRQIFNWNKINANSLNEKLFQALMTNTESNINDVVTGIDEEQAKATSNEVLTEVVDEGNNPEDIVATYDENGEEATMDDESWDIDDDDTYESLMEDSYTPDTSQLTNVDNIAMFASQVDYENIQNMEELIYNGDINIKCK